MRPKPDFRFGVWRVTRFYVPLLLQAFSQSLTYPLVAGIVTHGTCGVNALTAFSQGQMIMFMIGALGCGLVTTGMVFAKTWYGYLSFKRLNALMMAVLLALQCVPAVSPFNRWLFEGFFALPPELAEVSRWTLLAGVVMNGGFFLRNVPIVVLFNNLESGKANNATIARILATLVCAVFFPKCGWVGPWWGLVALTLGVWVELALTWWYARPYVRDLRETCRVEFGGNATPPAKEIVALTWEQFRFTLPLALGGLLLASSPLVIAAFVGRSANATDMLAIHYVTIGVANPVAYAALRMQPVAVKFLPEYPGDRRLLVYAAAAGALLGVVPFLFSMPFLGDWYFGHYQNVPKRLLGTAELAIGLYSFVSIFQAIRGHVEGIAARKKRPEAVMAGQLAYTVSLLVACAAMLPLGCPGWVIAITSINLAPLCTIAATYLTLRPSSSGKPVAPGEATNSAAPCRDFSALPANATITNDSRRRSFDMKRALLGLAAAWRARALAAVGFVSAGDVPRGRPRPQDARTPATLLTWHDENDRTLHVKWLLTKHGTCYNA